MSYDLMLNKAIELHNMGAMGEAMDLYQKILQAMPENSDVWNLMGLISQSKDEHIKAVDSFLNAIKFSPKPFAPYFFNLGLSYKSLNKKSEAIESLEKAISLDPNFKEAWNFLGIVLEEIGEHNLAIEKFCKALDIDVDYEEARANLCFYTNDFDMLKKLAEEQNNNFMVNLRAGLFLNDIEKKEYFLRRAIDIEPDRIEGLIGLAGLLFSVSRLDEALIYYHKVLNINDNNYEAILGVADVCLAQNDLLNAEKYYKKSLEISRDNFGVYLNYGSLLYKQSRIVEALDFYRKAITINPESAEASYNLSLILKDIGDFEEALGLMFNAHLRDKDNNLYAINIMETLTELAVKNPEMALKIAMNWQKLDENNIFSNRFLSGLSKGSDGVNDEGYAKVLFDVFADSYDEKMRNLNVKLIDEIKRLDIKFSGNVLDLGCGTGVVAENFAGDGADFYGVDISAKMIEIAKQKNIYKELYAVGIKEFLSNNKLLSKIDLVIACDVFCYIGDLEEIICKLKGKKVVFSVEKANDDIGKDYYLQPNGRYKHSEKYIKHLAKRLRFNKCDIFDIDTRLEANEMVKGLLVVLSK